MNPTLRNVADILPALLRNAIPKPSGPGFLLELEGAEMDALRQLRDWLADERTAEELAEPAPFPTFPPTEMRSEFAQ